MTYEFIIAIYKTMAKSPGDSLNRVNNKLNQKGAR